MLIKYKRGFLLIISCFLIAVSAKTSYGAENNTIYEQCYLSKVKGAKVGYSCESQKEISNKYIITNRYSKQEFKRFGFTVKFTQDLQFVEDNAGNPVSILAKIEGAGQNINLKGEFSSPDKVRISSTVNGVEKSQEIALKKKVLFPYAISKLFKENADKISYSTIDADTDLRIVNMTAEKVGTESLPKDNLTGEYTKYKVSMDILPNINNFEWYNNQGIVVKEQSSFLDIESIATSKDIIFGKIDDMDILTQSLIPVEVQIHNPFQLEQVTYKIETQNLNPNDIFLSDDRQKIIQTTNNKIYLKIKNESPQKFCYPVKAKEYSEYLKSGPFIIKDSKQVKDIANSLVGQDKDAYKIAKKMEKWVYKNITKKDLSINFANTNEILKLREGDCTEHSILLASLLRAAGNSFQGSRRAYLYRNSSKGFWLSYVG